MIYLFTIKVVHWSSVISCSRLLKLSERYLIGRLFWLILSTIGFSHNRP